MDLFNVDSVAYDGAQWEIDFPKGNIIWLIPDNIAVTIRNKDGAVVVSIESLGE